MEKIKDLVNSMDPKDAAAEIAAVMKALFSLLDEGARLEFVMNIIGDTGEDKVGGLVHL